MTDAITYTALADILKALAVILPVLFFAAMFLASRYFATRKEVDGVGSRVNALETVVIAAKDTADSVNDRVALLEERARHQWDRTMETLDRVSKAMEKVSGEQEATSRQVVEVVRDLKHLFKRLDGGK